MKRAWDLERLTAEDERQLGAVLNLAILHQHRPLLAGPLPARLEAAARPFLTAVARPEVRYTFTVLDCDEVNAFSHPGGYVYACRGLLEMIGADEDPALEFVVGHEVAHVDLGHAVHCLRDPLLRNGDVGTPSLFCSTVLPFSYPEEQDFEADRWAYRTMLAAERSRHESLTFLRKLTTYELDHGFGNQRMKPFNEPPVDPIDNHLRAHVIPRRRLEQLPGRSPAAPAPRR